MQGALNPEQEDAIRPHVTGKMVVDYGAGDRWLSRQLIGLGASHVCAVDKDDYGPSPDRRISTVQTTFLTMSEVMEPSDAVAFVSWPANNNGVLPLVSLLDAAPVVVYLGKNTGGISCGVPALFEYFLTRELLAYVPHPQNTLIILGARLASPRVPTGEEKAAFSPADPLDYETAER